MLLRNRPDDDELLRALKEVDPDIIVANNWRTWLPPEIFDLPPPRHAQRARLAAAHLRRLLAADLGADQRRDGGRRHRAPDGRRHSTWATSCCSARSRSGPTDTATDLFHRTVDLIGPIVVDALDLHRLGQGRLWTRRTASKASFFHKRSIEDSRIDWTWPAEDLERLVRAQSDPYPNAFTYHGGERVRIVSAAVSEGRYGGTPGRIFIREGDGVVIVAGADARTGRNHGLLVRRVRPEDGTELPATDYFRTMGGYLTARPACPSARVATWAAGRSRSPPRGRGTPPAAPGRGRGASRRGSRRTRATVSAAPRR